MVMKPERPRLSVLMPCGNAAATVDEAIESILAQSLGDFELIAVDDGSSDGTRERLSRWEHHDARVRVLSIARCGIIGALNAGLAACRAPLVARMDADDVAAPARLELQAALLDREPGVAVAGCLVEVFPEAAAREGMRVYVEWLNGLCTPEAIARAIFIESPLVHSSVVMRREWVERVGGYQEHGWAEDYDLWLRLHLAGARFAKVEQVLLRWREHPGRLTWTDRRYAVENFLRAKARYLCLGPLRECSAVLVWGAGMMGRRLARHLQREGAPLSAFVDIDPRKIGRQRRGCPVLAPEGLPDWWQQQTRPAVLAAVGSRGARAIIRQRLEGIGLVEGADWWAAA
jgi:glycosyltransferase involved in cell wall biosynthesis